MKNTQVIVHQHVSNISSIPESGRVFAVPRSGAEYQKHSRLYRAGKVRRLSRGVYHQPEESRLVGTVPPSPQKVAEAVAKRTGETILPSEAWAANLVGVSTQVPSKYVYWTTGTNRTRRIGGYEFQFKRGVPKRMVGAGSPIGLVFQAIRYLGPERARECGKKLLAAVPAKNREELSSLAEQSVAWVEEVVEQILTESGNG